MISPNQDTDSLLKDLNMGDLEGKEREEVLERLEERFHKVVLSAVFDYLSESELEAFKLGLKSENSEAEVAALCASIPGLAEIIEKRLEEEYKQMKSVMA